eukprot:277664_1
MSRMVGLGLFERHNAAVRISPQKERLCIRRKADRTVSWREFFALFRYCCVLGFGTLVLFTDVPTWRVWDIDEWRTWLRASASHTTGRQTAVFALATVLTAGDGVLLFARLARGTCQSPWRGVVLLICDVACAVAMISSVSGGRDGTILLTSILLLELPTALGILAKLQRKRESSSHVLSQFELFYMAVFVLTRYVCAQFYTFIILEFATEMTTKVAVLVLLLLTSGMGLPKWFPKLKLRIKLPFVSWLWRA